MKLKDSGKISGIVVLNKTESQYRQNLAPTAPYSNDLTCPNKFTGIYFYI